MRSYLAKLIPNQYIRWFIILGIWPILVGIWLVRNRRKVVQNYRQSSIRYRSLTGKEKIIVWLIAIAPLFVPVVGMFWYIPFVLIGTFAIIREIRDRGNNRVVSSIGGLIGIFFLFVVGVFPVVFANPAIIDNTKTNPIEKSASIVDSTITDESKIPEASPTETVIEEVVPEEVQESIPTEAVSGSIVAPSNEINNAPVKQESPQNDSELYTVASVVDGDTAKLIINGKTETLRIIGLDTPETKDPRKPVQCFGREATAKAKDLLEGKKVRIESDSTQGERDKYERLLLYIILPDGRNFSKVMIEDGYAFEYTYNKPYKYQSEFKQAQATARDQNRGLWSPNTCNGESKSATTTTPVPVVTKPKTETPTPSSPAQSTEGVVKKSKTGKCHAPGTQYYDQTINFTPYNTLQECLDSGGIIPG